jgi:Flp pilus assembly protein TadD
MRALCLTLALLFVTSGCASLPWKSASQRPLADDPLLSKDAARPDPGAAVAKGFNLEQTGQLEKARETYEKVLRDHPDQAQPLHRLAVVADKQHRHSEAQALYMRAIQLEPRNAELFNDLGYSFYLAGQFSKAESALAKATTLDPQSPRYRNNLGMVIGMQGRIAEAYEQFAQAGSLADAHYNVAFVYSCQNNPDQAKRCFERALASDPTHEKARKALDSFRQYEEGGSLEFTEQFTADGRPWVFYKETPDGQPDIEAMAEQGITHQVDSALPAAHNVGHRASVTTAAR